MHISETKAWLCDDLEFDSFWQLAYPKPRIKNIVDESKSNLLILFCLLQRTNAYIKDVIKYVPTMGWCWWFAGWGFLKRNWKSDQTQMHKHIESCKRNKTNYSVSESTLILYYIKCVFSEIVRTPMFTVNTPWISSYDFARPPWIINN